MRLLLLGGSSFVGSAIRRQPAWPAEGWWTFHTRLSPDADAVQCDINDADGVARLVERIAPTHVIDASLPGRDNPTLAAAAARNVCEALSRVSPRVRYVLVSSDAVFSGNLGKLYAESDNPDPNSDYGKAKAAAEAVVQRSLPNHCIARTCLVYGLDHRGPTLNVDPRLAPIVHHLRHGRQVRQYSRQFRTPTCVDDLAPGLLRLLHTDLRGIFHLAGYERMSRAAFARFVASGLGLDAALVVDQPLPPRPRFGVDTSLSSAQACETIDWSPRTPEQWATTVPRSAIGIMPVRSH